MKNSGLILLLPLLAVSQRVRTAMAKRMMPSMAVLLSFCLTASISFSLSATPAWAAGAPTISINGEILAVDPPPVITNGRTLVPLRAIFEAMDAEVGWDGDTSTVTGRKNGTTITLVIGEYKALRNDETVPLDAPATIIDGRTMVPLRFISEALGGDVAYDPAAHAITITTGPDRKAPAPDPSSSPDDASKNYGIIRITSPVTRNQTAEVAFKGRPLTEYRITVTYASGESKAAGLENKTADENGLVSWTWKIGAKTAPGTYSVSITDTANTQTFTGTLTVSES